MNFSFRPGFVPSAVTLVVLAVLLNLGGWQLRRAAEKDQLLALRAQANESKMQVSTMADFERVGLLENVTLKGQYLDGYQLFHDNQIADGLIGVHVLLPFRMSDGGMVLVNQGFLPINSRQMLSQPVPADLTQDIVSGYVNVFPAVGYRLGGIQPMAAGSPKLLTYLIHDQIEQDLDAPLGEMILLLDAEVPAGLSRNWKVVEFGPERHRAYAFQWFSLALALFVIYVAVNLRIRLDSDD